MPRPLSQAQQAAYLAERDPILGVVIGRVTLKPLRRTAGSDAYFAALVRAIISQQISTRAADTIQARLYAHVADAVTPAVISALSVETLRTLGISGQKASYLHDLALHVLDGRLDLEHVATYDDAALIDALVAVKGIGPWTAEMFLIFSLGRPDVFSRGDLGLKNALVKLYHLREPISDRRLRAITRHWEPYRSLACRYLWASLESV